MNNILLQIKLWIAAMSAGEALKILSQTFPWEPDLVTKSANLKRIESEYHKGGRSKDSYDVALVNFLEGLQYYIETLPKEKLVILYKKLKESQEDQAPEPNMPSSTPAQSKHILFVESMPIDQQRLQLDVEYNRITKIADSGKNNQYTVERPLLAATLDQLIENLNRINPHVVHFSGHGHTSGIVLSTPDNRTQLVPNKAICRLFNSFNNAQCVLLNACYSAELASELSKQIKYVIGMNAPINDDVAIEFTTTFYTALCNTPTVNYKDIYTQATVKLLTIDNDAADSAQLWSDGIQVA